LSAYVIVSYDISDPEGYKGYVPGVLPLIAKHGGEVLVADFSATCLEGDKRSVHVVLRFASEGAARAWYDDPEYEPVRGIRHATCSNNSLVVAKEFVPPGA
jgi:uncharacterized protein (DUF1330 family)